MKFQALSSSTVSFVKWTYVVFLLHIRELRSVTKFLYKSASGNVNMSRSACIYIK